MSTKNTRWVIEATSNIPDVNKQLERLIQLQQEQNQLTQQNTSSTALAIQRQREQIESLTASQQKSNTAQKDHASVVGTLKNEYGLLTKQLSGIISLAAGAWAVGELKSYVMAVVSAKSAQDSFAVGLAQMLQSKLLAERINSEILQIAVKSPFTVQQVQEVTTKLIGMGVEANKIIPYVKALGDISSVVGTEKLPLIAKALTDVQNKGKLMGQEIRQFTDNGIPIFDLLAKSMEKPRDEVVKLANAHKISFADVEKALLQATEKGGLYYGQMAIQAEQLGGQVSNMADRLQLALRKVGDFFENGLKKGVASMGDLIDAMIGSESAINRLISGTQAAITVYVAYRLAVNTVNASLRANSVATLEGIAAKKADELVTVSMTAGTNKLGTATVGLWTAMKANPIGAIITLVTALYGAYQLWQTYSMDVVSALGEEEIALKNSQALLNGQVKAVMDLKEGTAERMVAMQKLIQKYPEYFSGLNAEKTNNLALKNILDSVNLSYAQRIDLARQAYVTSEYEKKRSEMLQKEFDLMETIKRKSPELYAQVAGDSQKLLEVIDKGGSAFLRDLEGKGNGLRNLWESVLSGGGGLYANVKSVANGLKEIDTKIIEASTKRSNLAEKEQKAAVATETARWKEVEAQLTKGTKEYQSALADHNKKIGNLSGSVTDVILKNDEKVSKAKKNSLELSLENDLKELRSVQQTVDVKMAILSKEEALKIEQTKRQIVNVEDQQKRIESIEREYSERRSKLSMDYSLNILKGLKESFDKEIEQYKAKSEKIESTRKAENIGWKKHNEEIAKLDQDLIEIQIRNKEKQAEYNVMYNAEMLESERKFWQDKDIYLTESYIKQNELRIANMAAERDSLAQRADILKESGLREEEYKQILIQIAVLNGKIAEEEAKNFQEHEKLIELKIAKSKKYFNEVLGFFGNLLAMSAAERESYSKSWDSASEAVDKFYAYAMEANKKSFDFQIENSKLSLSEMTEVWSQYAERQRALMDSKQQFDIAAQSMKNVLDNMKEVDNNMSKFTQLLSEGKWVGAVINAVSNIFNTKKRLAEATHAMEETAMQQRIDNFDMEISMIDQLLKTQQSAIQSAYDAKVEAINKEMAAEEAKYAKLTAAEQEFYSANQNRLKEDDDYRQLLMAAGEAREVAKLEKQKQLLIDETNARRKKGESDAQIAKEVADITIAFDKLIADTHAQYQDAIGNKTAETSLANTEVKAQEADGVNSIQDSLQKSLDVMRGSLYDAQVEMQNALLRVAQESARQQLMIESAKFEAMRQMAMAELMIVINKAAAKGDPIGRAIAITERERIKDMPNPFNDIIPAPQITPPSIPRNTSSPTTFEPNNTSGRGESSGRPRFHGDTYVELNGNPDGIDTVPLRLHKGERIVQSYLNNFIGRNTTNEQLVHGYLQYANMSDRMPAPQIQFPKMILPDFSKTKDGAISMEKVERKLDALNQTIANKSLLNVHIDSAKISVTEIRQLQKINHYNAILKK